MTNQLLQEEQALPLPQERLLLRFVLLLQMGLVMHVRVGVVMEVVLMVMKLLSLLIVGVGSELGVSFHERREIVELGHDPVDLVAPDGARQLGRLRRVGGLRTCNRLEHVTEIGYES